MILWRFGPHLTNAISDAGARTLSASAKHGLLVESADRVPRLLRPSERDVSLGEMPKQWACLRVLVRRLWTTLVARLR